MEPSRINPYESPGEPEFSSEEDALKTESRPGFLESVARAVVLAVVLAICAGAAVVLFSTYEIPPLFVGGGHILSVTCFFALVVLSAAFGAALLSARTRSLKRPRKKPPA